MSRAIEPWRRPGFPRTTILRAMAFLYGIAWWLRRRLRRGHPVSLPVAVLSVGNLSVGGTGKSLLVRALAARAERFKKNPAILLRGYGALSGPRPLRVSTGEGPMVGVRWSGDEAAEHALSCTCPVWVDADRLRAGRAALAAGANCLLLDDGFQRRWQLARSLDLLLADYHELSVGERLLPAGPFREPWSQVSEADAVLVSGAPRGLRGRALRARLPAAWRTAPLFRLDRVPSALVAWPSGRRLPLSSLRGRSVAALSGLGRPEVFEGTLESLGAQVLPWRFGDHHPFTDADLMRVPAGAALIVTTAKDAVRLPRDWRAHPPVAVLKARANVSPAAPFWRLVDRSLNTPLGGLPS